MIGYRSMTIYNLCTVTLIRDYAVVPNTLSLLFTVSADWQTQTDAVSL